MPNTGTTYTDAEDALKTYFIPKAIIVAECKSCQVPQVTKVLQYIVALQELVVSCEFGTSTDETICDQLVESVLSPRICERPSHGPLNSTQVRKRKSCFCCGLEAHLANALNCPAATVTCRKSAKVGC